ncbi:MAG TPA: hypothetical protein PLJ35_07405 [Anaerolineae bacterium]|nr:hypothetical protein [Anaerolineae bacterium]HOQ98633.1 hypothetical protein [Anaerolineae bacterium]HPL28246.1 hypothetical protein [Anaerolineae bacterium]
MDNTRFDQLYANVPSEQRQMLLDFRAAHPVHSTSPARGWST